MVTNCFVSGCKPLLIFILSQPCYGTPSSDKTRVAHLLQPLQENTSNSLFFFANFKNDSPHTDMKTKVAVSRLSLLLRLLPGPNVAWMGGATAPGR